MLKLLLYTYILVTIIKINKMVVKSLEYTQMNHYKNIKSFMSFITVMLVYQFSPEFSQYHNQHFPTFDGPFDALKI